METMIIGESHSGKELCAEKRKCDVQYIPELAILKIAASRKKSWVESQSDSTVNRASALHVVDLGLITDVPQDDLSLLEVIPQCRARSKP